MGTNFPHESIGKMGAWSFWADPDSLELAAEDAAYALDDPATVPVENRARIEQACYAAFVSLRDAEVGVPLDAKPS